MADQVSSMGVSWTDRQLYTINVRDKNILVSAAAGSGKTAVLVERIKKLIIDEQVSIDEMLVATFTNAAAGDMKDKIVKAIQKAAGERESDQQFLKKQLSKVYKANISTFHSFAIEVIRRYFYVINADPEFKICDDTEKTLLRLEAADELFEKKFDSNDGDFISFLNVYCDARSERNAKDMVLYLHEKIQALPEPFEWLSDKAGILKSPREALLEYLRGFITEEVVENLEYAKSSFLKVRGILEKAGADKLAGKSAKDIASICDLLEKAKSGGHEEVAEGFANFGFERFAAGKEEKEAYEGVREQVSKIRDKGKDCVKEIRDKYFSPESIDGAGMVNAIYGHMMTLTGLVLEFDAIYKAKKDEKGLLDFNDIEHLALKILKDADVSGEYRKKFKYIFVDEYQDCNLLQEEMINLIKRDNNVFMVGDVKQSIYKFRLAEPEIFMSKYEAYKKAAGDNDVKIDLNTNFRSSGGIINVINEICGRIMPYDEDSALYQGVPDAAGPAHPPCLHIVETKEIEDEGIGGEINELKKVEVEAGVVVNLIKDMAGKVRLSDIVILMRSARRYGEKYYEILTDAGIPAYIDDNDGYFDTIEIEIFMNLLKIIDNKRQDIPLISLLYSKIMGFSAGELAAIRAENMGMPFYKAFERYKTHGEDAGLAVKCRAAYTNIEEWRALSFSMPLDEFLWKLMRETGFYIYAGALPGGSQRQGNLRALVDKALRYTKTSRDGLYGFIRYAGILKEKGVQTGQVSLVGENDEVVRIMTVHKSKGLEFPVVIVAGLGRRFMSGREKSDVSVHKNIGIALLFYDAGERKNKKTILQQVIEGRNKREDLDEEARILYVALTRAKERLILVGAVADGEKAVENYRITDPGNRRMTACYLDMIAPVFMEKGFPYKIHNRADVFLRSVKSDTFKEKLKESLLSGSRALPETEKEFAEMRLSYEYPEQKSTYAKAKYSVSEMTRAGRPFESGPVTAAPVFIHGKRKPTKAEIGTAVHTVMEKTDFKEAASAFAYSDKKGREYLTELVDRLAEKFIIAPDAAKLIDIKVIEAFIKSDIGARAAKAPNLYKETPFNIIKEVDGVDTIIQGVIDCYFEEAGEYVLIDYKTDRLSGSGDIERVKEMYAGQAALYGEALETVSGIKVKEKYLYLFGLGAAVAVD